MNLEEFFKLTFKDLEESDLKDITFEKIFEDLQNLNTNIFKTKNSNSADKIIDFIDKNTDLDIVPVTKKAIEEAIKNNFYWNESLKKIYDTYAILHENKETRVIRPKNGRPAQVEELYNADAGKSFERNEEWVKPWLALFSKKSLNTFNSYKDIRDKDAFMKAIMSDKNMQFTHIKGEPWIRLLMPKNTRRVEIEDLNRNFWVISITLSVILEYLFDQDSPLKEIFQEILDEILQLWENCFYLWFLFDALSKEGEESLYSECTFLSPDFSPNELQFDDFEILGKNWRSELITTTSENQEYSLLEQNKEEQIIKILQKYKEKYQGKNLCIIPLIRVDNYKHNYFREVVFPYIYLYDAKKNKEQLVYLLRKGISKNTINGVVDRYTVPALDILNTTFNGKLVGDYIYGATRGELVYYRSYPYSSIENYEENESKKYYAAIRPIPNLDVKYKNGKFIINFDLEFEDCVKNSLANSDREILCNFKLENYEVECDDNLKYAYLAEENFLKKGRKVSSLYTSSIQKGRDYYLGEVISDSKYSLEKMSFDVIDIDDFVNEALLVKIGNFLPYKDPESNFYMAVSSENKLTQYDLNVSMRSSNDSIENLSRHGFFIPYYDDSKDPENPSGEIILNSNKEKLQYHWTYSKSKAINSEKTLSELENIIDEVLEGNIINREDLQGYIKFDSNTPTLPISFVKKVGYLVIKEYLEKIFENSLLDSQKYLTICSGIGCQPWRGSHKNQYYWEYSILTHLFFYIPKEIADKSIVFSKKNIDKYEIKVNNNTVGYLILGKEINRNEVAFGENNGITTFQETMPAGTFKDYKFFDSSHGGDRWRLPQIDTIEEQKTSIKLRSYRKNEEYFYWVELDAYKTLKNLRESLNDDDKFKQQVKDWLDRGIIKIDEKKCEEAAVYDKILNNIINTPKFKWSIYDGYRKNAGSGYENNLTIGRMGSYREIGEVEISCVGERINANSIAYFRTYSDTGFTAFLKIENTTTVGNDIRADEVVETILPKKLLFQDDRLLIYNGDDWNWSNLLLGG